MRNFILSLLDPGYIKSIAAPTSSRLVVTVVVLDCSLRKVLGYRRFSWKI